MDKSKIVPAAIVASIVGSAVVVAGLIKKKYLVLPFGVIVAKKDKEVKTNSDEE